MTEVKFELAKPSNLPKAAVFQLAEKVAAHLGYDSPSKIRDVVHSLGGKIVSRDFWSLDPEESGSLEVLKEGEFTIFLQSGSSKERENFTIAHELGHYVLHFVWKNQNNLAAARPMRAWRYGSEREEWEANWFASAFLMPQGKFDTAYTTYGGDLSSVARLFGVSFSAAQTRARVLGLI